MGRPLHRHMEPDGPGVVVMRLTRRGCRHKDSSSRFTTDAIREVEVQNLNLNRSLLPGSNITSWDFFIFAEIISVLIPVNIQDFPFAPSMLITETLVRITCIVTSIHFHQLQTERFDIINRTPVIMISFVCFPKIISRQDFKNGISLLYTT